MSEQSVASTESLLIEMTGLCLHLYARSEALFDLLEERIGAIDEERWETLLKQREQSLFEDLLADGWSDLVLSKILKVVQTMPPAEKGLLQPLPLRDR